MIRYFSEINFRQLDYKKLIKDIWIASRPLSLTLALYSTTLGMVIAHMEGKLLTGNTLFDVWKILLVTAAGLFVQTATNFINDYFESGFRPPAPGEKLYNFLGRKRPWFDILIFLLGVACFGATALIGLYLVWISTPLLLIIGGIGLIGGYCYTGEPVVYKRLGLGALLSFILMGVLMVCGSYMAFTGYFSWASIVLGLPVTLMIPLMMISNELRDYQRDKELNIRTLTVRIGFRRGKALYLTLLSLSYALTSLYTIMGLLPWATLRVWITLPLAIKAYKTSSEARREGVPDTNKLHLIFGLLMIISMLFG
jgi:1,4-dihydroxy-2-naphthoate octaprenyltransferase